MERNERHEALAVFAGRWSARGTSFGGAGQDPQRPKAHGQAWLSTHEAWWHTGRFFMVQDERADIEGSRFDTLSVMGLDEQGRYFARSFENHGFYRDYPMTRDGDCWTLAGQTERATIRFEDGGKKQVIAWEWLRDGQWLPLCERVAIKVD